MAGWLSNIFNRPRGISGDIGGNEIDDGEMERMAGSRCPKLDQEIVEKLELIYKLIKNNNGTLTTPLTVQSHFFKHVIDDLCSLTHSLQTMRCFPFWITIID